MNEGEAAAEKTTKKGSGNFACKYLRYTSLDTLSTKTSKDPGHDGVYSPSNNQPAHICVLYLWAIVSTMCAKFLTR